MGKISWLFCVVISSIFSCFSFCYGQNLSIPSGVLIGAGLSATVVAKFVLFIAVLLLWTVIIGKILKIVFHLPTIAGQIIGGILLGPSWINIAGFHIFSFPITFFEAATNQVYALAASDLFVFFVVLISSGFTVSYLLWIAGHETDIRDILKVGVTAVGAGILGAVLPVVFIAAILFYGLSGIFTFVQAMGLGLVFSATSVSIPVAMLFSQHKMHLKSSKATLGAAIIDDIFAILLLSVFFIGLQTGIFGRIEGFISPVQTESLLEAIIYMGVSFAVIFCAGYFLIPPILKWLQRKQASHLIAPLANGIMLLYFAFAELVGGLAGITGAYFAGLFHRMGDTRHYAEKAISPFVNAFLLPLFLGSIGLQVDISILDRSQWIIVLLLLFVAIFSKLLGCYVATWLSNLSGRRGGVHRWSLLESYLFGASMVARGEVGLVVSTILHSAHVLSTDQYVIGVVVIVLTTVASPIMLSLGFSQVEAMEKVDAASHSYMLNIGRFEALGTERVFAIITNLLAVNRAFNTSIQFSEGRKVVNLQGHDVKIVFSPEEGILFEGNKENIEKILQIVKDGLSNELGRFTVFNGPFAG